MTKKVLILDYDMGNVLSVKRAVEYHGASVEISNDLSKICNADRIIIPGVGNFSRGIKNIKKFKSEILTFFQKERPLMGICLGMQLMFENSEEDNFKDKGLSIFNGNVLKFKDKSQNLIVPHIGWTNLQIENCSDKIFKQITKESKFYFIHSYYCNDMDINTNKIFSFYSGIKFTAASYKNNIFLFQFHPEKSSKDGIQIYKNFLEI